MFELATWRFRRVRALRRLFRSFARENCPELRGRRILVEWLSPTQRAQFHAYGFFDVTGSDSGSTYRIHYGTAANVQEIDRFGRPRQGWCFVPTGHLVPGDVMLAQKIALETSENETLAVANHFPVGIPDQNSITRPQRRAY
jgi:hypothetical protein